MDRQRITDLDRTRRGKLREGDVEVGRSRRGRGGGWILGVIVVLIVAVAIGVILAGASYRRGVEDGRAEVIQLTSEKLDALTSATREKAKFLEMVETNFSDISDASELNDTWIENYLSKLNWLKENTVDEDVKAKLGQFIEQASWLRDVYVTGDNVAINAEFGLLKEKAKQLGEDVTKIYNTKIQNAVESL